MKKIALITGTSKGIGKAVAELLLKNNYLVFGYSRTNTLLHPNFTFNRVDLSNLEEIQKLVLPKITNKTNVLLINNAATIGSILPLNLKSENDIIKEFCLNSIAPTIIINKFLKNYTDHNKILINIGSGAANKAIASWSIYCATKASLDRITEVIAKENHKNLKLYSIHPGVVNTDMQKMIRSSKHKNFPLLNKFTNYYTKNKLETTRVVALKLLFIIENTTKFTQNIISIRDIYIK